VNGAWTIAKREIRAYFQSPVAYAAIIIFLLLRGLLFLFQIRMIVELQLTMEARIPPAEQILRQMFGGDIFLPLLLIVPLLTMRLLSEERSQHTAELLLTAPIGTAQVVLGKFLAAFTVLLVMVLLSVGTPALFIAYTGASWLPVGAGLVATLLLGSVFLAVGLMASSLTESQFVAAVLAVAFNLFVFMLGTRAAKLPLIGTYLDQFSMTTNMENLVRGVVDTSALLYFFSTTALFLFLTSRLLDSQRWR
jgi:ABC-2 type transport system permease protein